MRLVRHEVRSILSATGICALGLLAACSTGTEDETAGSGGSVSGNGGGNNAGAGGGANPGAGGGANPGAGGGANPGAGGGANPGAGGGANPGAGGGANPGAGGGANPGAGGGANPTDCTITASHAASPQISTVFTVDFVTDFTGTATINFGKVSEGFTLVAPVEAGETSALLLGMTHSTEYQYQVVVTSGADQCVSETMTLTTGGFPGGSGLADATIQPGSSSSPVEPGFIVSSSGIGQGTHAYIVNHEGEMVWWYEVPFGEVSSARMSWDGKFMYARELNVGRGPNGRVMKVGMNGLGEEVVNLATSHHDFAPTPDGGFLYIAGYGSNSCDGIFKYPSEELLFDVDSAFSWTGVGAIGAENCHTNAIQYNEFDNSVTFSDTNHDAIVSVDYDTGALNWIYGGAADSTFTGDVTWEREHGHHMPDADTMYVFSNGAFTGGMSNIYRARFSGTTATWDWQYNVQGLNSSTLGDVQGLPGGNVLVTYSSAGGVLHEVDENEQLVRSLNMPFTNSGYASHRPTLYGKPSR